MQETTGQTSGDGRTTGTARILAMVAMIVAYAAAGAFFRGVLKTDYLWSHLGYVPIVFACAWWGMRGIAVVPILAAVNVPICLAWGPGGGWWSVAGRAAAFLLAGICVGVVSERFAAERAARKACEDFYRALSDKAIVGIAVCRRGEIIIANPRLCAMLGRDVRELIGRKISDFLDSRDATAVGGMLEGIARDAGAEVRCECRLRRGDGSLVWADVGIAPFSSGDRDGLLFCAYDITARKEAEAKRVELTEIARRQEDILVHSTRLAELGEMAAAIAHELNQPLTGIRNYAKNAAFMLEKGAGSREEMAENLRQISAQVDRAARIIGQMRDLTRRRERQFAPVDVNAAVRESIEFLMPQFRLTGVEVGMELGRDVPKIMGDRIRLEQVFLNLLTNARQAMEESEERKLKVVTRSEPGDVPLVAIEITDTGRGFGEAERAKMFTPFYTTKKPGQGTGLGLSISLRIVRDHGGTISAEGRPGRGATFTVRLPAAPGEEKS
ncbi:MAG: ATP-binding protein [Planctomycetota bacterium]|nr:ATP-binding protein [Planctomycetota bacterium]